MLELNYSKFLFNKKEVWFFDGEQINESPYTTYLYYNTYPGGKIIEEESCLIDLTKSLAEIKANISKTTQLHINKANNFETSFNIEFSPSLKNVLEFNSIFKLFAQKKNIAFSSERIIALHKTNNLVLSYAYSKNELTTIHAYLHDSKSVVLLHTFNLLNNNSLSAICNKYLHWQEIVMFKEKRFQIYDFGGIDLIKVPGISQFKLSFGATIVKRYSAIKTNSFFKLLNSLRA
ncbi:MAG: hypothetical protein V4667_12985 [Bacteroidota bacterium]